MQTHVVYFFFDQTYYGLTQKYKSNIVVKHIINQTEHNKRLCISFDKLHTDNQMQTSSVVINIGIGVMCILVYFQRPWPFVINKKRNDYTKTNISVNYWINLEQPEGNKTRSKEDFVKLLYCFNIFEIVFCIPLKSISVILITTLIGNTRSLNVILKAFER